MEKRDKRILINLTQKEYEILKKKADLENRSVSNYIISKLFKEKNKKA